MLYLYYYFIIIISEFRFLVLLVRSVSDRIFFFVCWTTFSSWHFHTLILVLFSRTCKTRPQSQLLTFFHSFQRCCGCHCSLRLLLSSNQPSNADPVPRYGGVISKIMWCRQKMWKVLACATSSAQWITAAGAWISTLVTCIVSWTMLIGTRTPGIMCWYKTTPTVITLSRFVHLFCVLQHHVRWVWSISGLYFGET